MDTVDKSIEFLARDVGVAGLGNKRNDGNTRVTTNDSDILIGRVGALDFADEAGGSNDIKSGDTEKSLGIIDALALVDFGDDGDGGVDLRI